MPTITTFIQRLAGVLADPKWLREINKIYKDCNGKNVIPIISGS